jgi:hypothetical protein
MCASGTSIKVDLNVGRNGVRHRRTTTATILPCLNPLA